MKKSLLFCLLLLQLNLFSQWKAYVPALPDTLGTAGLSISPTNNQVAWAVCMKYNLTATGYEWLEIPELVFTKTSDGGDTWTGGVVGSNGPFLSNVSPLSGDEAWVSYVNADFENFVLHTTDGGKTWTRFLEDKFVESTSYVDFVHFFDKNRGIAVGDPAPSPDNSTPFYEIYLTSDGGQNWSRVPSDSIPAAPGDEFGSAGWYQVRGNTIWFVAINSTDYASERLFRSTNGGQSWEAFDFKQVGLFSFGDSKNGMFLRRENTDLKFYRTNDGGATWQPTGGSPGNERATGLAVVPQSGVAIVTQRVSVSAPPFYTRISRDGGATWMDIGTATENVGNLAFDSPTIGYGGEWQPADHPNRMYKYVGDPLTGLFSDVPLAAEFSVSPNPSSDFISVKVETAEKSNFLLLLNDSQGRLIERVEFSDVSEISKTFDLQRLPAGVYTLTLSSSEGMLARSVVKN